MAATVGAMILGQTLAAAGTSAFLIQYAVGYLATTALTTTIMNALAPKPSGQNAGATGYQVAGKSAAADHQVIYGATRAGGVVVYDATTGQVNNYLHRVVAFAGHEIEEYTTFYLNDEALTLDSDGNVTSPSRYNGYVRINTHLGTDDQAADSDLVSEVDEWTNNHRLRGVAYVYFRLKYNQDVFPNGVPDISCVIKGKKVYDPRTGTTAWSDNPALCIRDYLTSEYGLNESASRIDDELVKTAANVCEYLNYPTLSGGDRFTLNGNFVASVTPHDLLTDMLTSMGGLLWYSQGKWRMKPAYYTAPVLDLNEDDLRSSISVATRHSRRNNFNEVKGTFRGADTNYQPTDYNPVFNITDADGGLTVGQPYAIHELGNTDWNTVAGTSGVTYAVGDVFVAATIGTGTGKANYWLGVDGGDKSTIDLNLPFTDDFDIARRIARIMLERNRQQLTVQAKFGMRAFQVQVGDTVRITNSRFGWTNKEFEVVNWSFGLAEEQDLQTDLTLREISSDVFDDVDDGAVLELDNTSLDSPFDVQVPTLDAAVVSTHVNEDGTTVPSITFSWSVTNPELVEYYEFQFKLTGDTTYNTRIVKDGEYTLAPALSGSAYNYRVRAVNQLGVKSQFVSGASTASTGNDATTPNAPTNVSVSASYQAALVTWDAPTTNTDSSALKDLFQYKIYRGTSDNPTTLVGRVSGETFSDSGLNDNQIYYYRVKAIDFTGNESAYSASGNGTTNAALTDGVDGIDGADGADGNSVALLSVYKRASSAPSTPTGGSFNFGTTTLTAPSGWSTTPPSGSDPLYISNATASVQGSTGTDSSLTWSQPDVFAENGADGADGADGSDGTAGKSVYTAIVFNRYASAPSTPTGGSFNFGTNTLTPPTGWLLDVPSGSNPVYGTRAVFSITGDTGTDSSATWSTPFRIAEDGIDGLDGNDGADGLSTFLASVFKRSASAPSTPTGGSYDFGTNTLTAPSGWSVTAPAGSDPLYVSTALASVQGVTGTDSSLSWTGAVVLARDGADGADGAAGADGGDGARGAGRWHIGVTSLPTTSSGADTDFTNAIGDPVDLDQAFFYTGTLANPTAQGIWIYDESTDSWDEQIEYFDGGLLIDGTVTADHLSAQSISALGLTIGTLSSAASGARLELKDDRIQVYDSSGTVRVKIGNLS